MNLLHPLLSSPIKAIDHLMRQRLDIWEFSDDPDCILRLGTATAHIGAELSDGTIVQPGDTVGIIHLWNERMPVIPPSGYNITWARTLWQALGHSFHLMARHLAETPTNREFAALGGELPLPFTQSTIRMLRRLGLEIFDPVRHQGLEQARDLGARLWTWLMRWAFNPESVRGLRLSDLERRPTWISKKALIAKHAAINSAHKETKDGKTD